MDIAERWTRAKFGEAAAMRSVLKSCRAWAAIPGRLEWRRSVTVQTPRGHLVRLGAGTRRPAKQMEMPTTSAILHSVFRLQFIPLFYTLAIFAVIVATFGFHVRRDSIFACPAKLYDGNSYLGYCGATAYGDYDHGAFWFGLEPEARQHAAAADMLFIGNSRLQFGFSAPALGRWFSANHLKYYLVGFSHFENSTFLGPLLRGLHPRARAYVINVDDFFVDNVTDPGNDVMHGLNTRARYETKRTW